MTIEDKTIIVDGKEVGVKQFKNDWALALMSRGIIVRISISRWRAMAKLSVNDLGLKFVDSETSEFMRKYIRLGTQKLLPPEVLKEINNIETRARNNLTNYSFDTLWGKFVPNKAFKQWEDENNNIREEFIKAANGLMNRYDEIVVAVKNEYKKLARDVWARLYPGQGSPTESFVENFSFSVVDKIPSKEDVFESFKYTTTYLIIPMPSFLEEDLAKAQEIKRQNTMKNLEASLEMDIKRRIADNYIEKKKELVDGFLESTVVQMRKYVSELCDAVLQSIGKRRNDADRVKIVHINKLKKMIKRVDLINFHNDEEINSLLRDLESEIDKFKGERNDDIVIEKLQEIVQVAENEFLPKDFNPAIGYLEV